MGLVQRMTFTTLRKMCGACALLAGTALCQQPPDPAYRPIEDDPALPRVLLIGDSISVGYTLPVRELLRGKANVHRIPENGGPTSLGVQKIDEWLGGGKWDVIHFNFGLHDLKLVDADRHQVPLSDYEFNLSQIVEKLKGTGAKLIWASTTPVPEGKLEPPRRTLDVTAYNAVAAQVIKEAGIPIDDLYAFALPRVKRIQRPANVHFTEEGSRELAGQVASAILAALGKK